MYQTTHRANAATITPAQYQPRSVSSLIGSSSVFREGLYTHDISRSWEERGEVGSFWKGDYYLKPRLGRGFLMRWTAPRLRTLHALQTWLRPGLEQVAVRLSRRLISLDFKFKSLNGK